MKSRNIHIDKASRHIQHLVLDAAALGRHSLLLKHFNTSPAETMVHEWRHNIVFCESVRHVGNYRADHIAEECLEEIAEKLKGIFPDSRIDILYSGIDKVNDPRLIIDWS